jgi:nucleoside-diphosphate-sugar epimerase
MNAFVTGAAGFIGSHLVEELVRRGVEVTCLARRTTDLKWIEDLDVKIIYGDCEDPDSLLHVPLDFDYIFHLAGITKAHRVEEFFCANVNGTKNLLQAVASRKPALRRVVYLSSLAAAGPSMDGIPLNESSVPHPVSNYGRSKLQGEEIVMRYRDVIPVTIIRPPAVYGPRDKDFHVLFKMLKKGFYPYWGKCYYSILFVDDLVKGIVEAASVEKARGGTYFLSDGKVYTTDDLVDEIEHALNINAVKMRVPMPVLSILVGFSEKFGKKASILNRDKLRELNHSHWICDISKAEREIGFIPRVTIKEGLKWTADWYRIHQWL